MTPLYLIPTLLLACAVGFVAVRLVSVVRMSPGYLPAGIIVRHRGLLYVTSGVRASDGFVRLTRKGAYGAVSSAYVRPDEEVEVYDGLPLVSRFHGWLSRVTSKVGLPYVPPARHLAP